MIARMIPESWRWAHRAYARALGYFWLPCPACGRPFGGHEWRAVDGLPSSVRLTIERDGETMQQKFGICPACTRAGRGSA